MKRLITIGIVALLVGLVLSVPLRVNGLEDEKSIIEGKIPEPTRSNPARHGLLWAMCGFIPCLAIVAPFSLLSLVLAVPAIVLGTIGMILLLTIVGIPLAFPFLLLFEVLGALAGLCSGIGITLALIPFIIGLILAPILFIIGYHRGKANIHYCIERAIIRRIDAIIPG